MIRKVTCAVFLGLSSILAGCGEPTEPSFAMKNEIVELDLHSLVRGQSNELLSMTEALQKNASRSFSSPRKLSETLEESIVQMDQIHMNLPTLLADQDVEIATMRQAVADKTTSKSALKARYEAMRAYRTALIQSLDSSAGRTSQTLRALQASERPDLMPLMQDAKILSLDLNAARTMIQMQM